MAKHVTGYLAPPQVQTRRHTRNDQVPHAMLLKRVANGLNWVALRAGKSFVQGAQSWSSWGGAQDSSDTEWCWACGRTGYATVLVRHQLLVAPAYRSGIPADEDPYVYVEQLDVDAASTSNSDEWHYGRVHDSAGILGPGSLAIGKIDTVVSPNTEYQWTLHGVNSARIISWTAFELSLVSGADDSLDGVTDPSAFVVEAPISAASIQDLLEAGTDLWKKNGAHLASWTAFESTAGTTSATYLDHGAAGPLILPVRYHNTARRDHDGEGIPCVFCARASSENGNTSGVRLIDTADSSVLAELTGFGTTPEWKSVEFELPSTTEEAQVQVKSDGLDTVKNWAYSLSEQWYEPFVHYVASDSDEGSGADDLTLTDSSLVSPRANDLILLSVAWHTDSTDDAHIDNVATLEAEGWTTFGPEFETSYDVGGGEGGGGATYHARAQMFWIRYVDWDGSSDVSFGATTEYCAASVTQIRYALDPRLGHLVEAYDADTTELAVGGVWGTERGLVFAAHYAADGVSSPNGWDPATEDALVEGAFVEREEQIDNEDAYMTADGRPEATGYIAAQADADQTSAALLSVSLPLHSSYPPAWTLRAQQTALKSDSTADIQVTKPAGTTEGDLLVFVYGGGASAAYDISAAPSSEWRQAVNADDTSNHLEIWWKIAGGSEGASYTFTLAGNPSNPSAAACWLGAYQYVGRPESSDSNAAGGDTDTFDFDGLAVSYEGSLLVAAYLVNRAGFNDINVDTAPAGMTERAVLDPNPANRPDLILCVYDESVDSAVAANSRQLVVDQSDCRGAGAGVVFAPV